MDSGNMGPKDTGKSDDIYPVVKEYDSCSHWECAAGESLAPCVSAGAASIQISGKTSVSIGPAACAAVR